MMSDRVIMKVFSVLKSRTSTAGFSGVIIVESPEVYTRERLVNDRLRETAWLERQLLVTEKKPDRDAGFTTIEATRDCPCSSSF